MNKKNIILSIIFSVISFSYVNSNLSTTDNVGQDNWWSCLCSIIIYNALLD